MMLSLLEDVRKGKKVNLFPIYFAPSPFFLLVQLSGLHSAINFHIIKNKNKKYLFSSDSVGTSRNLDLTLTSILSRDISHLVWR